MKLTKTIGMDRLVRLEGDNDTAVTLFMGKDKAEILSFVLPHELRGKTEGAELLRAAEREASAAGKNMLELVYPSRFEAAAEALEKNGFTVEEAEPIYRVKVEDLLNGPEANKLMGWKADGLEWVVLGDLLLFQREELLEMLAKYKTHFSEEDLDAFDQDLSGVVYDDDYNPMAMIFCTPYEDELLIDLLFTVTRKNLKYLMVVLQSFAKAFMEQDGSTRFQYLTMMACREQVRELLLRILGSDYPLDAAEHVMRGYKEIELGEEGLPEPDDNDSDPRKWLEEVKDLPYQKNISWKHLWVNGVDWTEFDL